MTETERKEHKRKYAREYARRRYGWEPRPVWPKDPVERSKVLKAYKKKEYAENREYYLQKSKYHHARARQRLYGVSPEQYDDLLVTQGHVCAICKQPDKTGKALSVDHNHDTGEIRGLLCANCNIGLGNFFDTPANLIAAARYLEKLHVQPNSY